MLVAPLAGVLPEAPAAAVPALALLVCMLAALVVFAGCAVLLGLAAPACDCDCEGVEAVVVAAADGGIESFVSVWLDCPEVSVGDALLLQPARHIRIPQQNSSFMRRTVTCGLKCRDSRLRTRFHSKLAELERFDSARNCHNFVRNCRVPARNKSRTVLSRAIVSTGLFAASARARVTRAPADAEGVARALTS